MTSLSKCRRRKDAHLQHVVWLARGGGGVGWGGGKGKGGVGLMHVYSSCIFNLLFSSILFVVVFCLFFSNQLTPVSVAAPAAPCGTSCDENVFLEQLQQSGVCHFQGCK